MRIVPPEELRLNIAIKLTVMPGYVQRETGINQRARDAALDAILSALNGTITIGQHL